MRKIRRLLLLALACAAILLAGHAADAGARLRAYGPSSFATPVFLDKFFGKKQAAMPKDIFYTIHDDPTFESETRLIHLRPYDNPLLEFDIPLPKNWTSEDITKSQSLHMDQSFVGDIAALRSETIGVYRINVYVSAQTLKYETSARSWLKNYLLSSGFAPQGEMKENGPREASGYYTATSDKGTMNTYISARISGKIAMAVRCEVPLQIKDYASYIQKKIVDSFQITYLKEENVEEVKPFTLIDALKFSYPVSWETEDPDFKDMSRLSVGLRNKGPNGATNGFIGVIAVRRSGATNLVKEVARLKTYFSDFMGINISKLVSSGKAGTIDRFLFSRYEVYAASYKKEGHADPEIHLAALGDRDWYIFAYMITPGEQNNLAIWGRNTRTLELILNSMR